MDNLQLNNSISEIETTINKLKNELTIIENEKKRLIEKQDIERQRKKSDVENANIMRKALNYFARGYSTWETAEKISNYFTSVWDAYYYISSERGACNASPPKMPFPIFLAPSNRRKCIL